MKNPLISPPRLSLLLYRVLVKKERISMKSAPLFAGLALFGGSWVSP
jgi:hypothetical protein